MRVVYLTKKEPAVKKAEKPKSPNLKGAERKSPKSKKK